MSSPSESSSAEQAQVAGGHPDEKVPTPPALTDLPDIEPEPSAVETLFGERAEVARRYTAHLATSGVEWGLIGPREAQRLWTRHVLNSAVLAEAVPADAANVVDVGSGAGLPGIPLAIARPDLRVVLLEPLERRATWLTGVVSDLDLNAEVVRGRAEDVVGEVVGDVVTSRAVAPLPKLLRWSLPLMARGGVVLALKGQSAQDEVDRYAKELRKLRVAEATVIHVGKAVIDPPTTIVRVVAPHSAPQKRPARRARKGDR